MSEPYI